jgi:hypothetical protein
VEVFPVIQNRTKKKEEEEETENNGEEEDREGEGEDVLPGYDDVASRKKNKNKVVN